VQALKALVKKEPFPCKDLIENHIEKTRKDLAATWRLERLYDPEIARVEEEMDKLFPRSPPTIQ